ncbi:unnamed protein product [Schistosoma margrebowiei]|uniref:Polysaccharide biosynthesis domain-containing protein n=1 Tax=Schistosoma margrebowiei TaxID=48269 RepID=A0A183M4P0_9TREM|nr:unnamed protein product [Schistosoma margrebowiei]
MVHMGSSILREQMANEPIVGHRLPWDCICLRCSTALWIRLSGRRLGVWPPKKTTCFGLGTRAVSQPSHISNKICKWRPFCNEFEKKVEDFNFGTLLRLDASKGYCPENTCIVPRIQFLALEIARNRLGINNTENSSTLQLLNR